MKIIKIFKIPVLLKKFFNFPMIPMFYMCYFFAGFFPRNNNLWLFGSWNGKRFADNPKYFFLKCIEKNSNKIICYWITKDYNIYKWLSGEGYPCLYFYSIKGVYCSLKAGVYVFDSFSRDISFWTSNGAFKVLLFHGVGIKKIGWDIDTPSNFFYKCYYGSLFERVSLSILFPWWKEKYNLIPSTSPYTAKIFQSAFHASPEDTPVTGFPRSDIFFETFQFPKTENSYLIKKIKSFEKTVIYMPTFRDSDRHNRKIPIDWKKLNALFQRNESVMLVKTHPNEIFSENLKGYTNILHLTNTLDPYPLLRECHLLITDYSTISFDFYLTGGDVFYFVYDIDKYLRTERSFYFDFIKEIKGQPVFKDFNSLFIQISEYLSGNYKSKFDKMGFVTKFHSIKNSGSSQRVRTEIEKKLILRTE